MALKIIGLGCEGYWSDGWNQLDGTIVLMSIIEMILTAILEGGGMNLSVLRILRMLRLVRVLRLMKSWKGLYKIVVTFMKAIPQMTNLFILMFLFMIIFSLLGMQIFGGAFQPSSGFSMEPCNPECSDPTLLPHPRFHFDYFVPAIMTVFVLMTGEWVDAMDPGIAALGGSAALYYAMVVLVGRYFLLNLLIAIVLNAFADDNDIMDEPGDALITTNRGDARSARTNRAAGTARTNRSMMEDGPIVIWEPEGHEPTVWPRDYSLCCFSVRGSMRRTCIALVQHPYFDMAISVAIVISSICLALDSPRLMEGSLLAEFLVTLDIYLWPWLFFGELLLKAIAYGFAYGPSAYLKSAWNQLDLAIVTSSFVVFAADAFPFLAPLKNFRLLRVLRPLRLISRVPGMKIILTSLVKALPAVSNVVGVILALNLVFAVLGMQLFMGSLATCTDPSKLTRELCVPSTTPVAAEVPVVATATVGAPSTPGRLLLDGAVANMTSGGDISMGAISVATSFIAKSSMMSADAIAVSSRRGLKGGSSRGYSNGLVRWANPRVGSFDRFGDAMLLLYVMSTGDEWEVHMYRMMDATEPGRSNVRNDYSSASLYSIMWMFVGSFFAMNLFVGVIVDNFNRIKAETDGSATMTQEQLQWVQTMKALAFQRPNRAYRVPAPGCRRVLFEIVQSQGFDGFIMLVIAANVFVMACDHWGIEQNQEHLQMYQHAMDSFTYVFYAEASLKIVALTPAGYFGDSWCRFDFFLVATSLVDQVGEELLSAQGFPLPPMLLRVLRVLRIVRILRLLKRAKELRDLIVTMIYSFPSLVNVSSLLALITFMYCVLGVDLFTFVAHQEHINESRNFETLSNSALTLFQCLTNDAWSGLMADAMIDESSGACTTGVNCGSWVSIPYFISFQILGTFVFLNLVVAVILENFTSIGTSNPKLVSSQDLDRFKEAWARFDPDADNYMPSSQLPQLINAVPPPLGLQGVQPPFGYSEERAAVRMCVRLDITQHAGDVAYVEVLKALIEHNFRQQEVPVENDTFREKADRLVGDNKPGPPPPPPVGWAMKRAMTMDRLPPDEHLVADRPIPQRFAIFTIRSYAEAWVDRVFTRKSKQVCSPLPQHVPQAATTLPTPKPLVRAVSGLVSGAAGNGHGNALPPGGRGLGRGKGRGRSSGRAGRAGHIAGPGTGGRAGGTGRAGGSPARSGARTAIGSTRLSGAPSSQYPLDTDEPAPKADATRGFESERGRMRELARRSSSRASGRDLDGDGAAANGHQAGSVQHACPRSAVMQPPPSHPRPSGPGNAVGVGRQRQAQRSRTPSPLVHAGSTRAPRSSSPPSPPPSSPPGGVGMVRVADASCRSEEESKARVLARLPPASTRRGYVNPLQTPHGVRQLRSRIMDRGF